MTIISTGLIVFISLLGGFLIGYWLGYAIGLAIGKHEGEIEAKYRRLQEDWKKMKTNLGFYCDLCSGFITKYQLDLKCCEIKTSEGNKLICDDCSKKIALYVVEEF